MWRYSGTVRAYFRTCCLHLQGRKLLLTNSMEQRPSGEGIVLPQTINFPPFVDHEILLPRAQRPLFVFILSQINPFHVLPSCFFKINFNIALLFMSGSSKETLSFKLPNNMSVCLPCDFTDAVCSPCRQALHVCLTSTQFRRGRTAWYSSLPEWTNI